MNMNLTTNIGQKSVLKKQVNFNKIKNLNLKRYIFFMYLIRTSISEIFCH